MILIPAYNEAEALPELLREIAAAQLPGPVVVIDDGSADNTADVAEAHGAIALRQPQNAGVGAAMRAGFSYAVEQQAQHIIRLDADGQHPPAEAQHLLDAARETNADLVIGSRFAPDTQYTGSWDRRLGVALLSRGLSWIVRQPLRDPASGFQVVSLRLATWFAEHYPDAYPEPWSLIHLRRAGFSVTEVPVRFRPRETGESSISGSRALRHVGRTTRLILTEALRGRVTNPPAQKKPPA